MSNDIAVNMKNITVRFVETLANDDISLSIKKGEIFAIVGENGAGKTTLMNVLAGQIQPTLGSVEILGSTVTTFSPTAAIKAGIGMVHQHFMLIDSFTVAQNIVLGHEPKKPAKFGIFFDNKAAVRFTEDLIREYGLEVPPNARVRDLGVGLQQRVEILKALALGSKVLILDEPTAVLTPSETDELFKIIRKLKEKGHTIIIITHKLYEVMEISDRVAVLRAGKLAGIEETKNLSESKLASMMVGHELSFESIPRDETVKTPVLDIKNLTVSNARGLIAINDLNLTINSGEIVGIAGVEGNGQSELAQAITGLRPALKGSIYLNGIEITKQSPEKIRKLGLAHIPEDRIKTGLSKQASIWENLLVGKQRRREFAWLKLYLRRDKISKYSKEVYNQFDVRGAGIHIPVGSLSGGNMQKIVVGREFSFENTRAYVISQPTRGLDIAAMQFIHKQIINKRNEGAAILLISADLDEIFMLSDRICTLFEGKITAEFDPKTASKEKVGLAMLTHSKEEVCENS
jgi:ABC-type uncharacterized transport system ATPase subunit